MMFQFTKHERFLENTTERAECILFPDTKGELDLNAPGPLSRRV